jgi:hypothetical protein
VVKAFDFDLSDTKPQKKPAPHTPAGFLQALIKIYVSPCNLPNLFSCQTSSSLTCVSYPAYAGMSLTNPRVCKLPSSSNPMFGAKPITFGAQHEVGSYLNLYLAPAAEISAILHKSLVRRARFHSMEPTTEFARTLQEIYRPPMA